MKKIAKFLLLVCFSAMTLCGCGKNNPPASAYTVVTGVDISFQYKDTLLHRQYTDEEKMRSVLLYLRLLKPLGSAKNEAVPVGEDIYEIALHFSDGSSKYYRQAKHRYLSRPNGRWELIDPLQASQLYRLMRFFPSDAQL